MSVLGSTIEIAFTVSLPEGATVSSALVSIVDPDGAEVVTSEAATELPSGWVYYWDSPETGTAGDYVIKVKVTSGVNVGKGKMILTMEES